MAINAKIISHFAILYNADRLVCLINVYISGLLYVRGRSPIRVRQNHKNGVWACAAGNHGKIADKQENRLTAKYPRIYL